MLSLATCVFCPDLLAVDTLHRETLKEVSEGEKYARRKLTLSSSFARNSTNAAWTSSSGGAGRFELGVCFGGLGGLFGVTTWGRAGAE